MKLLKKLEGEICYLSPVSAEYYEKVAQWSNDIEVGINTGDISDMISFERQKSYLEGMSSKGYAYMIVREDNHEPVGIVRLMNVDQTWRRATLGIFIGEKSCWGMGIGTEAVRLILDFSFNCLNLHNIMLNVYSFNERALRLYEKCGFKEIGRRRECVIYGNRYYDEIIMDILDDEFKGSLLDKFLK